MRRLMTLAVLSASALAATGAGAAQSQPQSEERTLDVNGHTGHATVYRFDGRSYVSLETLINITNGTLTLRGDSIVVRLPAAPSRGQSHAEPPSPGMTNDFMKASLRALATLKEWTHTLAEEITRARPHSGRHLAVFHKRAADELRVATVDVRTAEDEQALGLLRNHFEQVDGWNRKLDDERRRMDMAKYSMSPDALAGDTDFQRITSCADFLATMLPSGRFEENGYCN